MRCASKTRGSSPRSSLLAAIKFIALVLVALPVVGQRVWLYGFVPADASGEALLPHFVNHYHQLGITYRRMLLLVHHDPASASRESLDRILAICHSYNLECRIWEETFSVDGQYREYLRLVQDFIYDPYDWVLHSEVHEFQDWEGHVKHTVEKANRMRAYYITGPMIDRYATDLRSRPIPNVRTSLGSRTPLPDIFDAFPIRCPPPDIIDEYTNPDLPHATNPYGKPYGHHPGSKVVAYRNSLRPTRMRDAILKPDDAMGYLRDCGDVLETSPALCPRMSLNGQPPEDLYDLTPYSKFPHQYRYESTPEGKNIDVNITLWRPVEWGGMQVPIHRISWADEVLPSHRIWLERFKGSCDVDAQQAGCTPALESWWARASMYRAASRGAAVKPPERCDSGRLLGLQTNTTNFGLAWEQFEKRLNVVGRVRNVVKGDSRTRLAALKKVGQET
mmetsp:Transcript_9443/g.25615  ORF Transcript_9443/g.25615 Transcript_9443/m.25615 type:complete len:448 (-) Transcript_9443:101-1444(-)